MAGYVKDYFNCYSQGTPLRACVTSYKFQSLMRGHGGRGFMGAVRSGMLYTAGTDSGCPSHQVDIMPTKQGVVRDKQVVIHNKWAVISNKWAVVPIRWAVVPARWLVVQANGQLLGLSGELFEQSG